MAAALPAFLVGGTPVRDQLAYVIVGYKIPDHNSWSFIAAHYMDQLWRTFKADLSYPLDFPFPVAAVLYVGLAVAAAAIVAVAVKPARAGSLLLAGEGRHPRLHPAASAREQRRRPTGSSWFSCPWPRSASQSSAKRMMRAAHERVTARAATLA